MQGLFDCQRSDRTHFGFATFKPSLNRLLTRAAQKVVTGTQAWRPALRGDLNLKEVRKGRAETRLVTFFLSKLWPKSDFNSCRPRDLAQLASQAANLSRGAGSQYHGQNKLRPADEELLRSNI